MKKETQEALAQFIAEWQESPTKAKASFLRFKKHLEDKAGVILDFIPRAGLTYSLRAVHENQKKKELFVMVDVIEDDPRWLSVCFYGEMISDPDELGDYVPEGLLGEDAVCFDLDEENETLAQYIEARIDDACASAAKG
jgi:hypothetical protein